MEPSVCLSWISCHFCQKSELGFIVEKNCILNNVRVSYYHFHMWVPYLIALKTCLSQHIFLRTVSSCDTQNISSFLSCLWLPYDHLETTGTKWLKTDLVQDNRSKLLSWEGNDNWGMLCNTNENTSLAKIVWILTHTKWIDSFLQLRLQWSNGDIQEKA